MRMATLSSQEQYFDWHESRFSWPFFFATDRDRMFSSVLVDVIRLRATFFSRKIRREEPGISTHARVTVRVTCDFRGKRRDKIYYVRCRKSCFSYITFYAKSLNQIAFKYSSFCNFQVRKKNTTEVVHFDLSDRSDQNLLTILTNRFIAFLLFTYERNHKW